MMVKERQLTNGVRVLMEKLPGMRSVTVGIWARAGSVMESPAQNGISHFIEHMLFKGTKRRNYKQIAEEIDNIGGQMNAFTSKEMTCYYAKVIDERLDVAVDVLCDMYCHSVFDEKELKKEKGVVLEEIAMSGDNPEDVAHEKISETFFAGNCLGQTILGPAENIRRFTRDDIRAYMNERYFAENTVVAVVGNYDEEALLAMLEEKLECLPKKGGPAYVAKDELWAPKKSFCLVEKDIEQAHVGLAFPSLTFDHKDKYALSVLSNVLGGSMSSRLFQKIREEMGMAYSVYCYSSLYRNNGMLAIYAGTSAENAPKANDAILAEVRRMKSDLLTKDELENTKEQLRGNYILGQESSSAKMNAIGRSAMLGCKPKEEAEVLSLLSAVTMDDIARVAETVFDEEKMSGIFVGAVAGCRSLEAMFS
ncbi:MAG: insulinase family protein [Christensenellaceae bacterium]|nr:insulinase family protein [Christensenellaceae bacterium]